MSLCFKCVMCASCASNMSLVYEEVLCMKEAVSLYCVLNMSVVSKRKHERHPMSKCIPCPRNEFKKSHVFANVYRMSHVSQRSTCERRHNALSVYPTCNTMCVMQLLQLCTLLPRTLAGTFLSCTGLHATVMKTKNKREVNRSRVSINRVPYLFTENVPDACSL